MFLVISKTVNAVPFLSDATNRVGGAALPIMEGMGGILGGINKGIYAGANTITGAVNKYNNLKETDPGAPIVRAMATIDNILTDPSEQQQNTSGANQGLNQYPYAGGQQFANQGTMNYQMNNNTGQPSYNTQQPIYYNGQTNFNTGQPNYNTIQPNYNTGQPNYNTIQPNYNTGQPAANTGQPNTNTGQPAAYTESQTMGTGQPNYNTAQPNYNNAQPNYNNAQPNYNTVAYAGQQAASAGQAANNAAQPNYNQAQIINNTGQNMGAGGQLVSQMGHFLGGDGQTGLGGGIAGFVNKGAGTVRTLMNRTQGTIGSLGNQADGTLGTLVAGGANGVEKLAGIVEGMTSSGGSSGKLLPGIMNTATGVIQKMGGGMLPSNSGGPVYSSEVYNQGNQQMQQQVQPNQYDMQQYMDSEAIGLPSAVNSNVQQQMTLQPGMNGASNLFYNGMYDSAAAQANAMEVTGKSEVNNVNGQSAGTSNDGSIELLDNSEFEEAQKQFNNLVTNGNGDSVEPLPAWLRQDTPETRKLESVDMNTELTVAKSAESEEPTVQDSHPCYLVDRLMSGVQITNTVSTGYKHCQSICLQVNQCMYFTFAPGMGFCYLFSAVTGTTKLKRGVSGPKICPEGTVDLIHAPNAGIVPAMMGTLRPDANGLGPMQRVVMNNGIIQSVTNEDGSLYDKLGNAFADGFESNGDVMGKLPPRVKTFFTTPPKQESNAPSVKEVNQQLGQIMMNGMQNPVGSYKEPTKVSVDYDSIAAEITGDNFYEQYYNKLEELEKDANQDPDARTLEEVNEDTTNYEPAGEDNKGTLVGLAMGQSLGIASESQVANQVVQNVRGMYNDGTTTAQLSAGSIVGSNIQPTDYNSQQTMYNAQYSMNTKINNAVNAASLPGQQSGQSYEAPNTGYTNQAAYNGGQPLLQQYAATEYQAQAQAKQYQAQAQQYQAQPQQQQAQQYQAQPQAKQYQAQAQQYQAQPQQQQTQQYQAQPQQQQAQQYQAQQQAQSQTQQYQAQQQAQQYYRAQAQDQAYTTSSNQQYISNQNTILPPSVFAQNNSGLAAGASVTGDGAAAGAVDLFDTSSSIVQAGSAVADAFPIMDMAKAGYQLYNSGFFRRKGVFGGRGPSKAASIPAPGLAKPSVECVQHGMQCCVPKEAIPRANKRQWPTLNGKTTSNCTAIEVLADDKLCVTVDFEDPEANCGTVKIKTKDLSVYQASMVMPGKMNDAICECIYNGTSIVSNAEWEVNMADVHEMLEKEKQSEVTADKLKNTATTAMSWTKMISDAAKQLAGVPTDGASNSVVMGQSAGGGETPAFVMPARDAYDTVSMNDNSMFAQALQAGAAFKSVFGRGKSQQYTASDLLAAQQAMDQKTRDAVQQASASLPSVPIEQVPMPITAAVSAANAGSPSVPVPTLVPLSTSK